MDILILGAGGMTGHLISIYLQEKGHNVIGFSKKPLQYCDYVIGDALDSNRVKKVVTVKEYDAVVNCIGVLNDYVDKKPKDGIYLNSYLPHYLVDCLKEKTTKLIQISTDCVFYGDRGGYEEGSRCDANSLYGRTKALGEINDNKNLTFRTSMIGPDVKEDGLGLLNWFLKQKGAVNGYTNAIWTGVSSITLAKATEEGIRQDVTGIYHLVNNETISKYHLLSLFNQYIMNEPIRIEIDASYSVDKSLINTREDFDFKVPSYIDMIKETKEWIDRYKQLYPHY